MDKIEISKILMEYLDKKHLDINRFFNKDTLADWSICDNYSEMRENVDKFKEFICDKFNIEKVDIPLYVHTRLEDIITTIMINQLKK